MKKLNAIIVGLGSILSIFPVQEPPKVSTPEEMQKKVWCAVGGSLNTAINKHAKKER